MRRLLLIFLIMMLTFSGLACVQTTISEEEKQLLFTFASLADYTNNEFHGVDQCESFQKLALLFLVRQYTYTFSSENHEKNRQFLFINSNLQRFPSELLAQQNILTQANAYKAGINVSLKFIGKGVHLQDDNRLFNLGDQNYQSFILNKENRKIGNLVITRVGRSILQVIILGLYFDDQDILEESMWDTVDNLRKQN